MNIAMVGGGMMGISLAFFLARRGVAVELFEATRDLGGLAGQVPLNYGIAVNRL